MPTLKQIKKFIEDERIDIIDILCSLEGSRLALLELIEHHSKRATISKNTRLERLKVLVEKAEKAKEYLDRAQRELELLKNYSAN